MPRPQLAPGTYGKISVRKRTNGNTYQARASARSLGGKLIELTGKGRTPVDAEEDLKRNWRNLTVHVGGRLNEKSTVAQAIHAWLASRKMDVSMGKLKQQSYEKYDRSAYDVIDRIGAVPLHQATANVMEPFMEGLVHGQADGKRSPSRRHGKKKGDRSGVTYAKEVWLVLNGAFDVALKRDVIGKHPFAGMKRPSGGKQIRSYLTPEQFQSMRESIIEWGSNPRRRSDWRKLLALVDVAMGTSMRIGEILALRPVDLRFDCPDRPAVEVAGTIVEVGGKVVRQAVPKHARQQRVLPLPRPVAASLRDLADTMPKPTSLLFGTRGRAGRQ